MYIPIVCIHIYIYIYIHIHIYIYIYREREEEKRKTSNKKMKRAWPEGHQLPRGRRDAVHEQDVAGELPFYVCVYYYSYLH